MRDERPLWLSVQKKVEEWRCLGGFDYLFRVIRFGIFKARRNRSSPVLGRSLARFRSQMPTGSSPTRSWQKSAGPASTRR